MTISWKASPGSFGIQSLDNAPVPAETSLAGQPRHRRESGIGSYYQERVGNLRQYRMPA
jgi:hypothetical protein